MPKQSEAKKQEGEAADEAVPNAGETHKAQNMAEEMQLHCLEVASGHYDTITVQHPRDGGSLCPFQSQLNLNRNGIAKAIWARYLTTRALPPFISFSTSFWVAIDVSPGVVDAKAPWAAP